MVWVGMSSKHSTTEHLNISLTNLYSVLTEAMVILYSANVFPVDNFYYVFR